MKMRFYNRNYVNTHFGGSLYAMTDPFYMLMLIQILGKEYVVWDKSANIAFIRPGKGTVTARFSIDQDIISDIIGKTTEGQKYMPTFLVDIVDEQGNTVARVFKKLYIRKKQEPLQGNNNVDHRNAGSQCPYVRGRNRSCRA